jgi:hypothetical protein
MRGGHPSESPNASREGQSRNRRSDRGAPDRRGSAQTYILIPRRVSEAVSALLAKPDRSVRGEFLAVYTCL